MANLVGILIRLIVMVGLSVRALPGPSQALREAAGKNGEAAYAAKLDEWKKKKAEIDAANNKAALYDSLDNIAFFRRRTEGTANVMALQRMRMMLGDLAGSSAGMTPPNGVIDSSETPAYEGPFILWAPGPDGKYGPRGS